MALPANVSFGTVTGRFLTATADSPTDPDRDPEGTAATDLTVRFTPNLTPAVVRDASASPPTIFALAEVVATVGASGDLLGPDGQPGIRLVATTGATLDPSGWTWQVTLSSPTFPTLSFSFALDGGQSIDLASVVQVPAGPGTTLAAWLQAVTDARAARDAAQAAAASVPSATSLAATYVTHLGPATADDTARINAIFTAARTAGVRCRVIGKPGENYQISGPLVLGSRALLEMWGATVTLLPGSSSHMAANYTALNPAGTGTDAAVTAGSNVVTTALAAQAAVGQTLTVAGAAGNGNGPLIGLVSAVNAGTITLTKLDKTSPANATTTVAAAAVTLSDRDYDVRILGGLWARGANGPAGSGGAPASAVNGHSIYLKHLDNYEVDLERATSTSGVTFVWPTSARNGRITVRDANVVRTVLQPVGPILGLQIPLIRGASTDDLVNLCGNVYLEQTDTAGDVQDVTIGDLIGVGVGGSILKLNSCQGFTVDGVRVAGGIHGTGNIAVYLGQDTARAETTGGTYGTIDLGLVDALTTSELILSTGAVAASIEAKLHVTSPGQVSYFQGAAMVIDKLNLHIDGTGGVVTPVKLLTTGGTIRHARITGSYRPATDGGFVQVGDSGGGPTIKHLLVDAATLASTAANTLLVRVNNGTIDKARIRDCEGVWSTNTSGNNYVLYLSAGSINEAHISGRFESAVAAFRSEVGATLGTLYLDGIYGVTLGRLANMRVAGTIHLGHNYLSGTVSPSIYTNGATITIKGMHPTYNGGSASLLERAASEAVMVYGLDLSVDASMITGNAKEHFYNNSASQVGGVGHVFWDTVANTYRRFGASIVRGTATLVAGTVTVSNGNATTTSSIRLTTIASGGTVGHCYVSSRAAGSFVITSTSNTDTSQVFWEIVS